MALADHALVVGINRYPGISMLAGAENDAQDFYEWVTDPAGGSVDKANALLILSSAFPAPGDAGEALPDNQKVEQFFADVDNKASANNIAQLGDKAGKRVWLFFSGHGFAPSLDLSGVLMANATLRQIHNIAAKRWADRLYEGGWFDEVLLFQDACRNYIRGGELVPPFLPSKTAPLAQKRARFYAFAAKDRQYAKELTVDGGKKRGAFTVTLMQGLRGEARDPITRAITTERLKNYLITNMRKLLPQADLDDDEVAKVPDVQDPDSFDIVPPLQGDIGAAVPVPPLTQFPVEITLPQSDVAAYVENGTLQRVESTDKVPKIWNLRLSRGLYKVVVGPSESVFEVSGITGADGTERIVHVRL